MLRAELFTKSLARDPYFARALGGLSFWLPRIRDGGSAQFRSPLHPFPFARKAKREVIEKSIADLGL